MNSLHGTLIVAKLDQTSTQKWFEDFSEGQCRYKFPEMAVWEVAQHWYNWKSWCVIRNVINNPHLIPIHSKQVCSLPLSIYNCALFLSLVIHLLVDNFLHYTILIYEMEIIDLTSINTQVHNGYHTYILPTKIALLRLYELHSGDK